jgi:hypothetical protein
MIIQNGLNPRAPYKVELYANGSNMTRHDCGSIASRRQIKPTVVRNNYIFEATLRLVEHQKTRSGTSVFILKCEDTNREFAMYPEDFTVLLLSSKMKNGKVSGFWSFRKQGPSIGLVREADAG